MLRTFFIFASILCTVTSLCRNYWTRYESSCYYFAHLPSDRVTWHQAVQECNWKDSHLVIVDTKAENDFIKNYLAELNPVSGDDFWTFGNDIHTEGEWNWGLSPNRITTSFWNPGEPSNGGGTNEDCVSFDTVYHFAWNDDKCDRPNYYICEISDNDGESIIG